MDGQGIGYGTRPKSHTECMQHTESSDQISDNEFCNQNFNCSNEGLQRPL